MSGNNWRQRWEAPKGGPSVIPGRTGAAWRRTRQRRYERDGGRCQVCGGHVDKSLPQSDPMAWNCDHFPTPHFVIRRHYEAGQIDFAEYERRANDIENCRTIHKSCHERVTDEGQAGPVPARHGNTAPTRPTQYGSPSHHWSGCFKPVTECKCVGGWQADATRDVQPLAR
jgi:5-methylcytosine-specific restriction endonuclease McrA